VVRSDMKRLHLLPEFEAVAKSGSNILSYGEALQALSAASENVPEVVWFITPSGQHGWVLKGRILQKEFIECPERFYITLT